MKKTKLWTWIMLVFWLLQLASEIALIVVLIGLKMLPDVLILAAAIVMLFFAAITGVLAFVHRKGKTVGTARRIIALLLAALLTVCCVIGCVVIRQIRSVVGDITAPNTESVTRDVYVRVDDPATGLQDAAAYVFAAVEGFDDHSVQCAIDAINAQLGKEIHVEYFESFTLLVQALYDEQVDALIMNSGFISVLEEQEGCEDFSEKTRLLSSIPVAGWEEIYTTEPTEQTTVPAEKNVTNSAFVVYISGSDSRSSGLRNATNSDVNIIAVVNPNTKQVLLLNTPRDSYIPNPGGNGKLDKLTHCGIFGVDCSVQALEDLYGIHIDHYAKINFTGFEKMIDAIGGITVYTDYAFTARLTNTQYITIQAGENHLDGERALAFARERYHVVGGDKTRGKNQMKVIKAVIEKLTSDPSLIFKYSDILKSLEGMFATSMSMEDISLLVKFQLENMPDWDVMSYAVSGTNGKAATYSMPGRKLSVLFLDEEQVDYAGRLIRRVLSDEVLTAEDLK